MFLMSSRADDLITGRSKAATIAAAAVIEMMATMAIMFAPSASVTCSVTCVAATVSTQRIFIYSDQFQLQRHN
jgi:hypothetical protein